MKKLTTILAVLLLLGCQSQQGSQIKPQNSSDKHLQQLVALMSGEFNSLKQSQQNDQYFHISLKMQPIWLDRNDGHWLYVEQAVGNMLDKPYRQRIYHVTALDDGRLSSAVYELPNPQAAIGAYAKPELLADLSLDDLILRTGCAVILQQSGNMQFSGSTQDKACLSQLRGATYATSIVTITADAITSWDQGFDENDEQVWGAVAGPYVFDRQ